MEFQSFAAGGAIAEGWEEIRPELHGDDRAISTGELVEVQDVAESRDLVVEFHLSHRPQPLRADSIALISDRLPLARAARAASPPA